MCQIQCAIANWIICTRGGVVVAPAAEFSVFMSFSRSRCKINIIRAKGNEKAIAAIMPRCVPSEDREASHAWIACLLVHNPGSQETIGIIRCEQAHEENHESVYRLFPRVQPPDELPALE